MNGTNIKASDINQEQAKQNLINYYNKAVAQLESVQWQHWYLLEFHATALECHKIYPEASVLQWCGVVSALSPTTSWTKNKQFAIGIAKIVAKLGLGIDCDYLFENGIRSMFKLGINKSLKILRDCRTENDVLMVLNAPKTSAFFLNGLHPLTATRVTVDSHMLQIITCGNFKGSLICGKPVNNLVSDLVVECANMVGILPHQFQALVWTAKVYKV